MSHRLLAGLLLTVAFGARLGYVEIFSYKPRNDARVYIKLGAEIARHGSYSSSRKEPGAGGTIGPSAYFPPGYPYFLGAVDLLDGHASAGTPSVQPARVAQTVLGTATVALIGLIALEAFGPIVALIALALAAVYPVLIELSGVLLSENLLIPLVLAAVWAALRARRGAHPYRWIAVAGLFTGLATLTHENGAVVLLALIAAVWTLRPRFSPAALRAPALLVAVAVLTVTPWTVRNALALHSFIPVSDETGITLAGTYNPVSARDPRVPYKWRIYYFVPAYRRIGRYGPRMTEPQLGGRLTSAALDYIGRHPFSPLDVGFHNMLRMLELEGSFAWLASADAEGLHHPVAHVGVIAFWIVAALALLGAFTAAARRAPRWLWGFPILFALSIAFINVETPRFRAPVDPFVILLAACALARVPAVGRLVPAARLRRFASRAS